MPYSSNYSLGHTNTHFVGRRTLRNNVMYKTADYALVFDVHNSS